MDLTSLTAISPIDGRYRQKTENLKQYFTEEALIKYRLLVEVEYFIALCNSSILQLNHFPAKKFSDLRKLYKNFSVKDAQRIKDIESSTVTAEFGGKFKEKEVKKEFLGYLQMETNFN